MIKRILYEIRWWRWFMPGSPSVFEMHRRGFDKNTRDVIEQRWLASEPSFNGRYPHRRDQQTGLAGKD